MRPSPYRHRVHYVKRFTSGTLAGLAVPASLPFASVEGAVSFAGWLLADGERTDCVTGAAWAASGVRIADEPGAVL